MANKSNRKKRANQAAAGERPEKAAKSMAAGNEEAAANITPWSENDPRFWWAVSLVLAVGILLRQWKLADAPYHTDEAIHAIGAYALGNYNYDPVYHGPLLYHLTGAVFNFKLFGFGLGDNDFTARLVPSLMGIAVLALVTGPARRFLGNRAALWGAALLAVSPVMVSYSRRLLHDSLVAFLTLGAVLCFQAARENPSESPAGRQARIGLALLLTLFVATKANVFFVLAMLAAFWVCTLLNGGDNRDLKPAGRTGLLWDPLPAWLPLLSLILISGVSIWAVRETPYLERNEKILKWASVLACFVVWEWLRRLPLSSDGEATAAPPARFRVPRDGLTPLLALAISALVFTFLFGHGVRGLQSGQPFTQSLVEAWGVPPVYGSEQAPGAIRRMLVYWSGQQDKPRLPGRHDYYLVMMALYELPIVIAALGGLVHAARRRTPFTDLLIWWAFTSWVVYAMANEKVPWLMIHLILPLALLAGAWLDSLRPRAGLRQSIFTVMCGLGAIYLLRGVSATNFERAADNHEPMFYAQTTEAFRDAMFEGLKETQGRQGDVWVYREKQWPMAWYLRDSEKRLGFRTQWDIAPIPDRELRLVVQPNQTDWNSLLTKGELFPARYQLARAQLAGWKGTEADFFIWPRASWSALAPGRWAKWWWNRDATMENGVLSEWSNSPAVVSVKP